MVLSRKDQRKASRESRRTSHKTVDSSECSNSSPIKAAVCSSSIGVDASSKNGPIQDPGPDIHQSKQRWSDAATARSESKQSETSPNTNVRGPDNAGSASQGGLLRDDVNEECSASSPESTPEPTIDHGDVIDNLDSTWSRSMSRIFIVLNTSGAAFSPPSSPPSRAETDPGASNRKCPHADSRRAERTSTGGRPAPAMDKGRPLNSTTLDPQGVESTTPWNAKQVSQGRLPPWYNFALNNNSNTLHVNPDEYPKLPPIADTLGRGQPGKRPGAMPENASERQRQGQASDGPQLDEVAQTMRLPESMETKLYKTPHRPIRGPFANSVCSHIHSPISQSDTSASHMTPVESPENSSPLPTENDAHPLVIHNVPRNMEDSPDNIHRSWTHHISPYSSAPVTPGGVVVPRDWVLYRTPEVGDTTLAIHQGPTGLQPNPLWTSPSRPGNVPYRYEAASRGTTTERSTDMHRPEWALDDRNRVEPSERLQGYAPLFKPELRLERYRRAMSALVCSHGCNLDDLIDLHIVQRPAKDPDGSDHSASKSPEKSGLMPSPCLSIADLQHRKQPQ
ncbi:MAG: hypothetical protein L6R37_003405 [Teloschistes peruensis]|nr:MAG: hypothetical protein L6R37_003405 [Teloschistes peruensis]